MEQANRTAAEEEEEEDSRFGRRHRLLWTRAKDPSYRGEVSSFPASGLRRGENESLEAMGNSGSSSQSARNGRVSVVITLGYRSMDHMPLIRPPFLEI